MRGLRTSGFAFLAVIAGAMPAWAFPIPDANTAPPSQHQLDQAGAPSRPYATNYSDEAARKLGVQDGAWEVFSTQPGNPLMPSLRGGIEHGGAMISLQWRPGQ